jgi:hypothetical protein
MMMIKLNDKGVRGYMAMGGSKYRPRLDWQSRTGTVAKFSRDRAFAYVVWNGNQSCDRVSVNLIEPTSSEGIETVPQKNPLSSLNQGGTLS